MSQLDLEQVKKIETDVESARIIINNLSQELIDHICCEVEGLMEKKNINFEQAYAIIKEQTGIRVLQEIQENTLYLTDKKYRIMKTTMKITGNVSLALLGLGTVLKIFHWPGASVALIFGFAILSLFFFPSAIYINQREAKTNPRPLLNISALLGGITFMLGVLFKVMHWPYASYLLLIGFALLLFVFMPVLLFVKLKDTKSKKEKIAFVLGAIAVIIFELATMFKIFHWPGAAILMLLGSLMLIGVFLPMITWIWFKESGITSKFIFLVVTSMYAVVFTSLVSMNVSADVLGGFVKEESNSTAVIKYFQKKKESQMAMLEALPDSLKMNVQNQVASISKESDALINLIKEIKLNLVQTIESCDKNMALTFIAEPELLMSKDNYAVVNKILLSTNGPGSAAELKTRIESFRNYVTKLDSTDKKFSNNIASLLSTEASDPDNNRSWEEKSFRNCTLISVLALLSATEKNVWAVETKCISKIVSR